MKISWIIGTATLVLVVGGFSERERIGSLLGFSNSAAASQEQKSAAAKPAAPAKRPVPVITGRVSQKAVDVRLDALGNVQPLASVTVRARVDTAIEEVLFQDGATVTAGQTLFRLDARAVDAQLAQAVATLGKDKALKVQAEQNLKRAQDLILKSAGTQKAVDDAKGTFDAAVATVKSDEAAVESLKVQLTYYTIKAPISGRVGAANLKVGNIARASEAGTALTTINQIRPVYVAFSLPQRYLGDLNSAMTAGTSRVEASVQGTSQVFTGKIAFVDNAIDAATGTVIVRAEFGNEAEALWPGAICNTRLIFRTEADAIVVPREAVQTSQTGTFIFVVEDQKARVRQIVLSRFVDKDAVIASGVKPGDVIVIEGQNQLIDGTPVEIRAIPAKAASLNAGTMDANSSMKQGAL